MKKANISLTLYLSILFLLFPNQSFAKEESIEKNLAIDGSEPVFLEFSDDDGNLIFTSWEKNVVRIRVEKRIKLKNGKRAERLLRETKVDIIQKGNSIRVEIKYPKIKGFFFWLNDFQRVNVSTEITLPFNSNLNCRTEDGSIEGKNLNGDMVMETEDGSIRLSDIQGSIQAETEDGKIILKNITGKISGESEDGDLIISGRLEKLNLESEDGDITIEVKSPSLMETDWKIKTEDGDINILLSSDFSANFLIKTEDGEIDCQIPLIFSEIATDKKLSGKINQGGKLLLIETEDGDISIKSLNSNDKYKIF